MADLPFFAERNRLLDREGRGLLFWVNLKEDLTETSRFFYGCVQGGVPCAQDKKVTKIKITLGVAAKTPILQKILPKRT